MLFNRQTAILVLFSLIGMLRASDDDEHNHQNLYDAKSAQLNARSDAANAAYTNRTDGDPDNNIVNANPVNTRNYRVNNRVDGNPYNNGVDGNPYDNRYDGNPYNNRYDGNPYNNRYDGNPYNNRVDGNPYNNRYDANPYNDRVPPPPAVASAAVGPNVYPAAAVAGPNVYPPPVRAVYGPNVYPAAAALGPNGMPYRRRRCQTEKFEHPVVTKKYSDSTGYWVLYTQILETRNVANQCHRNEYVYLAHRQKAGWFWNPRVSSLVKYSLGEPKFVSRVVRNVYRPLLSVVVNMSRNYTSSSADLDRIFPKRLAKEISVIGSDDTKWSETAKTSLPILQMDTAYFQTVVPRENAGSQHLKVLRDDRINMEILE